MLLAFQALIIHLPLPPHQPFRRLLTEQDSAAPPAAAALPSAADLNAYARQQWDGLLLYLVGGSSQPPGPPPELRGAAAVDIPSLLARAGLMLKDEYTLSQSEGGEGGWVGGCGGDPGRLACMWGAGQQTKLQLTQLSNARTLLAAADACVTLQPSAMYPPPPVCQAPSPLPSPAPQASAKPASSSCWLTCTASCGARCGSTWRTCRRQPARRAQRAQRAPTSPWRSTSCCGWACRLGGPCATAGWLNQSESLPRTWHTWGCSCRCRRAARCGCTPRAWRRCWRAAGGQARRQRQLKMASSLWSPISGAE